MPRRYRAVSLSTVDALTEDALREHFLGREAYRRTEYIVARRDVDAALIRVRKASEEPLFSPIVEVEVLAGPHETAVIHDPEVDTAIPTHLARTAREHAPRKRCAVVFGKYEHASFILHPDPVPVVVVEVEPPRPAKLVDQVRRVLDVAEDLPPVELRPVVVELAELARSHPADRYLFPCRGSGAVPDGAAVDYLDERPVRADWVLVGTARTREIHRWFYGSEPPSVEMCPRELAEAGLTGSGPLAGALAGGVPILTKCSSLEFGIEHEGDLTVAPWGATLDEIREGLGVLLRAAEPAWAPA